MGYRLTRFLIQVILRLVARLEVIGMENMPSHSSFIIAANHIGRLDAVLIYAFSKRKDIIMLAAEKYRKIPVVRWLAKQLDVIWVDRFNADFGAVRETLARLKRGGVLVLAPEGTRSPDGRLQKARAGASYLAMKAGAPILPVALVGSDDALVVAQLRRFKRPKVTIRVGKLFRLPPANGKDRDTMLEQYTDEIMCRIAALLPPERRGAYADHPRLTALLEEDG
jgi:1-acyl-sn-glycerol-3-phosphate acyltransferase